jgi:hypothetical protein
MRFQLSPLVYSALLLAGLVAGCASTRVSEPQIVPARPPSSSYDCRTDPVDGLPTAGEGNYGCHFYLLAPGTKRVRANTPYMIQVYVPGQVQSKKEAVSVELVGVTDAQGRSGFVRAPFPITPKLVRFVEVIGSGPYSAGSQFVRSTDGNGAADILYHFHSCKGDFFGLTDEQGHTPMFTTKESCAYDLTFAGCLDRTCTEQDVARMQQKLPQRSE